MAKILLVDDEESIRITVGTFIEEEGHEVHTAEDVTKAFELIEEQDFDVIVTDIIMPKITGIELLRKIHETSPDIPVIMMTGEPEVRSASEAVRAGAFDYLSKPITSDAIKKVIRNATERKALNDETKRLEKENRRYKEHLEELVQERTWELQESEERMRIIFEYAPDAVYINDMKGNFIDGNKAAEKLTGYNRKELIGKSFLKLKLLPAGQMPKAAKLLAKNVLGKATGPDEFVMNRRDGSKVTVEISTYPTRIKNRRVVLGIARDITARKRAEERFKLTASVTTDLIYEWDITTDSLEWFGNLDEALGYKPGKIPRTIEAWLNMIHPEDLEKLSGSVEQHRKSTEPIEEEYRVRKKDGTWMYWSDKGTPILGNNGKPVKWIGGCVDITERKKLEKYRIELEKMKSKFILTASHEIGTPVMAMEHRIDSLEAGLDTLGPEEKADISSLRHNLERLKGLKASLSNLAIMELGKFQLYKKPMFIQSTTQHVGDELFYLAQEKEIELVIDMQDLPIIIADKERMYEVISILMDNAIRYTPKGGRVEITGKEKGDHIEVIVKDNGIGIPNDEQKKIFDRFYQVKSIMQHRDGFGLGLSLAKEFIEYHGGDIRLKSVPCKGSSFILRLQKN